MLDKFSTKQQNKWDKQDTKIEKILDKLWKRKDKEAIADWLDIWGRKDKKAMRKWEKHYADDFCIM